MNNKYTRLLDLIFNENCENNSYSKKWEKFNSVANKIVDFNLNEFSESCSQYLVDKKGIDNNILGGTIISNDFPAFSENGLKKYYELKADQIRDIYREFDKLNDENSHAVFDNLDLNAIKMILNYCEKCKIIKVEGKVYNGNIIDFEKIKKNEGPSNNPNNIINNFGITGNISQSNVINDEAIYNSLLSNIESIRKEIDESNQRTVDKLVEAMNKKDKPTIISLLSDLTKLGSAIAPIILSLIGR